jgi:hypothetical protein
MGKLL